MTKTVTQFVIREKATENFLHCVFDNGDCYERFVVEDIERATLFENNDIDMIEIFGRGRNHYDRNDFEIVPVQVIFATGGDIHEEA